MQTLPIPRVSMFASTVLQHCNSVSGNLHLWRCWYADFQNWQALNLGVKLYSMRHIIINFRCQMHTYRNWIGSVDCHATCSLKQHNSFGHRFYSCCRSYSYAFASHFSWVVILIQVSLISSRHIYCTKRLMMFSITVLAFLCFKTVCTMANFETNKAVIIPPKNSPSIVEPSYRKLNNVTHCNKRIEFGNCCLPLKTVYSQLGPISDQGLVSVLKLLKSLPLLSLWFPLLWFLPIHWLSIHQYLIPAWFLVVFRLVSWTWWLVLINCRTLVMTLQVKIILARVH